MIVESKEMPTRSIMIAPGLRIYPEWKEIEPGKWESQFGESSKSQDSKPNTEESSNT